MGTLQCIHKSLQVHTSFFVAIRPNLSINNVAVRGSPVFQVTSLLSFQLTLVPIHTHGSSGASRVKYIALKHNICKPSQGLNSQPWDYESMQSSTAELGVLERFHI